MALVLADRVQETSTTAGTGALTLAGAVGGFQSFAVVGNGNTCYYTIVDGTAWEVGIGTYSTTGPTLARTTVLSNSSGTTTPLSLSSAAKPVFLTYPSEKSVNLDASGNVSPLGTIASGTWQGSTVGVAYGGTGVTASSGANSVMLRDANQNVSINRLNQSSTTVTAAGGTTTLTAASTFSQILVGTGTQTFQLPDATTLTNTTTFEFNNNATGNLVINDYASGYVGTISPGGAAAMALLANGTVAGTWDVHAYIPENVTWGTNSLALGSTVITGGTWNGGTITPAYGGTGLTSYTSGGAVYATGTSTLTSGTLPIASGGTGATTASGARTNLDVPSTTGSGASGTWGISITGNSATVASLTPPLFFNNMGNPHSTYTDFNSFGNFGFRYMQGSTNGPGTGASQYYGMTLGLGSEYSSSQYGTQLYWNRTATGGNPYLSVRYLEGGSWSSWSKIYAGYADSAGSAGSVDYNNLTNKTGGTGTYTTSGDYRAPIFYDSNNTGYYVDPASTSNFSLVNINNYIQTNSGGVKWDQSGVRSWSMYPAGGDIYLTSGDTSGSFYVTLAGGTRSPIFYDSNDTAFYADPNSVSNFNTRLQIQAYNAYSPNYAYGLQLGSNAGVTAWNFNPGGSSEYRNLTFYGTGWNGSAVVTRSILTIGNYGGYVGIRNDSPNYELDITGTGYASNDFRAPIFYDSNDTAYYLNPNSTTISLNTAGTGNFGNSGSDTGVGIYYGAGSGDYARIRFYQAYTNNQTIHVFSSTWQGGSFTGTSTGAININGLNGVTFGPWNSVSMWVNNSGTAAASNDFRAPIFYDSNNTGYYVDPNNTSNIASINVNGTITQSGPGRTSIVGPSNYDTRLGSSDLWFWFKSIDGNGSSGYPGAIQFGRNDSVFAWPIVLNPRGGNVGINSYSADYTLHVAGTGYASNDFRAPIFYDSNNTNYYVDPNSSSLLYQLQIAGSGAFDGSSLLYVTNNAYVYGRSQIIITGRLDSGNDGWSLPGPRNGLLFNINNAGAQGSIGTTNFNIQYNMATSQLGILTAANTAAPALYWSINDLHTYFNGNIYAPIFYDSNNTGYYCDPNGTSNFYALTVNQAISGSVTGYSNYVAWQGRISAETGRSAYYPGVYTFSTFTAANPGGNPPTTYAEILAWGGGANGAIQIAGDWISTTNTPLFVRSLRDCCQNWSSWTAIATSGVSFTNNVDLRAPIFYDSDNTSYYCNPQYISSFYGLAIRGDTNSTDTANQIFLWDSGNTTTSSIGFKASGGAFPNPTGFGDGYNTYLGMDTDGRGWVFRRSVGGSNFSAAYTSGWILNNGVWQANSSMRAPIFYDSEDTNYYCNPNGTSAFNSANAYGNWYFQGTTSYMYGNGSVNGSSGIGLNVFSNGGNGAIMAFHRGGYYAVNMGLDSDNVIRIGGWSASSNRLQMDMSGNLTMAGNVTAYSDERLKKDWLSLASDFIVGLAGVKAGTYTRIDSGERQVGVSAQDIQKLVAEAVTEDAAGMLSVNYGGAALAAAVELAKYVVLLEKRIAQLEAAR